MISTFEVLFVDNQPIDPNIQNVFDRYSEKTRQKLMDLRQLIIEVAAETKGVGELQETLKWGQISYLTVSPRSGTTIRIDEYHPDTQQIAMYVHCQTSLVETFRQMYSDDFQYEGNRAVIWNELSEIQIDILKHFIELALTYHSGKR